MKVLKYSVAVLTLMMLGLCAYVGWGMWKTKGEVTALQKRVMNAAEPATVSSGQMAGLPAPVQRYFAYTLPGDSGALPSYAVIKAEGEFRRPKMENFEPTSATQIISTRKPDLVFSASTPILGPLWADVYDAYIDGEMEMRASLLSAFDVIHFSGDETLNRISLRRWLLEASSWPPALLPGGPVNWQEIDDTSARAVVRAHGIEESLVALFDRTGALTGMFLEADGDLTTPYHGSGEHVLRGDYKAFDGIRIPTSFTISRASGGKRYPFWKAKVTSVEFGS